MDCEQSLALCRSLTVDEFERQNLCKVLERTKDSVHFQTTKGVEYSVNLTNLLGSGSYGKVFSALKTQDDARKYSDGDEPFAIKFIESSSREGNIPTVFYRSSSALEFQHPNVMTILDTYCGSDALMKNVYCAVVMKRMPFSLHDLLEGLRNTGIEFEPVIRRSIMKDLVNGLDYLNNTCHVLHKDIKPTNIMLDANLRAKLSDYDIISRSYIPKNQQKLSQTGDVYTICYRAPEVVATTTVDGSFAQYGPKADVWALGCVFSDMYRHVSTKFAFPRQYLMLGEQMNTPMQILDIICSRIGAPPQRIWVGKWNRKVEDLKPLKDKYTGKVLNKSFFPKCDNATFKLIKKMIIWEHIRYNIKQVGNTLQLWTNGEPDRSGILPAKRKGA